MEKTTSKTKHHVWQYRKYVSCFRDWLCHGSIKMFTRVLTKDMQSNRILCFLKRKMCLPTRY